MASVAVDYATKHTITRTFDTSSADAGQVVSPLDTLASLDATSTPAVTEGGTIQKAMVAGAGTVDLTSLTEISGRVFSLSGLKPRTVKIVALAANAGDITIAKGASNGYTGFGAAFSETLKPGGETVKYLGSSGTAVAGGVKTLDLSGTGTDGVQISISAGA
jgi:hypothetical protein